MFRTPIDGFFPDFLRAQNMVRVKIRVKLYRKWPEGKQKLVWVGGSSSFRGFELLRVKLEQMYDGNPREVDFGSCWHEVRVSEGSSYQESTVFTIPRLWGKQFNSFSGEKHTKMWQQDLCWWSTMNDPCLKTSSDAMK